MVGLTITGYKYALSTSADNITYSSYGSYITSSWTSGTTFTITGLTNGTYYKVKIRAVNALGDGSESAEIGPFRPNTVPGTPAAATLTPGDATDTFNWSAPASNGSTITKYAYQISTDNGSNWYSAIGGTLNGETETANLSVVLATQYSLSSYKLRVRAFNNGSNGGWSERSTISSSGTAVWQNNTGTETDTVCGPAGCSTSTTETEGHGTGCPDCATGQYCVCGAQYAFRTRSRTVTGTRTSSRTRSTQFYSRSGSTPQPTNYGAYSDYTYSAYSYSYSGYTYTGYGAFGACDATGTQSTYSGSDGQTVYVGGSAGTDYRTYSSFFGMWAVTNSGGTYTMQVGQCGGSCSAQNCFAFSTSVTQCNVTGTFTAVGYAQRGACANFGFGCTGSGAC